MHALALACTIHCIPVERPPNVTYMWYQTDGMTSIFIPTVVEQSDSFDATKVFVEYSAL